MGGEGRGTRGGIRGAAQSFSSAAENNVTILSKTSQLDGKRVQASELIRTQNVSPEIRICQKEIGLRPLEGYQTFWPSRTNRFVWNRSEYEGTCASWRLENIPMPGAAAQGTASDEPSGELFYPLKQSDSNGFRD